MHADHDQHKGLATVSLLCKLSSISKASLSWLGCWWEAKASCFPNIRLGVVLAAQSAQPRKKETTHSMHRLLANTPYSSTNQPRKNCSTDAFMEQNSRIYLYFLDTQVSLAPTPVNLYVRWSVGKGSSSCPANQMISNCHLGLCRSII